jgi:hypothetical protein
MKWKKTLGNFFKLDATMKKRLSLGRKQNGSPNHVLLGTMGLTYVGEQFPLGRKGLSCHGEQFSLRRKGLSCHGEQLPLGREGLWGEGLL